MTASIATTPNTFRAEIKGVFVNADRTWMIKREGSDWAVYSRTRRDLSIADGWEFRDANAGYLSSLYAAKRLIEADRAEVERDHAYALSLNEDLRILEILDAVRPGHLAPEDRAARVEDMVEMTRKAQTRIARLIKDDTTDPVWRLAFTLTRRIFRTVTIERQTFA